MNFSKLSDQDKLTLLGYAAISAAYLALFVAKYRSLSKKN